MTNAPDLALDDETARLLAASMDRYGREKYGFDARKAMLASSRGYGEQAWRDYADMGWLAVAVPLEAGGFGSAPAAVAPLMRYVGEYLALEPIFGSAVLCGRILSLCGAQAGESLDDLATGRKIFALAHAETVDDGLSGSARTLASGGRLTGRKLMVLHGETAQVLIVSAVDAGSEGITLYALDPAANGVRRTSYQLVDGRAAASFEFDAVPAHALTQSSVGSALLEQALDEARFALCAEAHGAVRALNRLTLAYLKTRNQFGRPIGTHQALQHRMVELFMLEQEVAAVIAAAQRAWHDAPAQASRARAAAIAYAMSASRQVSHEAVQMHGGIGITEELAVSHYFRRIIVINRLLGDRDEQMNRFVAADRRR